jgi:hypothetical protein
VVETKVKNLELLWCQLQFDLYRTQRSNVIEVAEFTKVELFIGRLRPDVIRIIGRRLL